MQEPNQEIVAWNEVVVHEPRAIGKLEMNNELGSLHTELVFTVFPRLPLEIQIKIFVMATTQPDAVIYSIATGTDRPFSWARSSGGLHDQPAVLQICQWIRQEFLTKDDIERGHVTYGLWRTVPSNLHRTFFLASEDIFLVRGGLAGDDDAILATESLQAWWGDLLCVHEKNVGCRGSGMRNVKHLTFGYHEKEAYRHIGDVLTKLVTLTLTPQFSIEDRSFAQAPFSDSDISKMSGEGQSTILSCKEYFKELKEAILMSRSGCKIPRFIIRDERIFNARTWGHPLPEEEKAIRLAVTEQD